jgi:hypothetical protein
MELIKKYGYIVLTVAVIIVLVILRSTGNGHFRYDAKKWAEPSFSGSNIVTESGISNLKGEKLFILLGDKQKLPDGISGKAIQIPPDSIMSGKYISVLRGTRSSVVLISDDYSVSAKIWMILSQAGLRNIYLYSGDPDHEVLKKGFRSDTLTRPE